MPRHFAIIFIISQLACGGAPTTAPAPTPGGRAAAPVGAQADPAGSAAAEQAPTDGNDKSETKTNHAGEFVVADADKSTRPKQGQLEATATEAAVRFFVVGKEDGAPIDGVVISLTSATGETFYTEETNKDGFTEVLLPIGKTYDLVYLSLGRRRVSAKVKVDDKPHLNLKLTLRYLREEYPVGLVLEDINFATGKAILTGESKRRLGTIVEYMTRKKSARVEISGHTDNVGSRRSNKRLSQSRADAVREYIVSQGIAPERLTAIGYGDEKPLADNKTEEGRKANRRIEAREL